MRYFETFIFEDGSCFSLLLLLLSFSLLLLLSLYVHLYDKYSLSSGASEDACCRHVTRRGCVQDVVRAHHVLHYVIITFASLLYVSEWARRVSLVKVTPVHPPPWKRQKIYLSILVSMETMNSGKSLAHSQNKVCEIMLTSGCHKYRFHGDIFQTNQSFC